MTSFVAQTCYILCDFAAVRSLQEQDTNLSRMYVVQQKLPILAVLILLPCRFQPTERVLQNTDHVNKVLLSVQSRFSCIRILISSFKAHITGELRS